MTDKTQETRTPSIQEALAAVMGDVREVRKTERNTGMNFNFRGIDSVLNAVGPALRRHSVVVMPEVLDHSANPTVTSGGKASLHVIVRVGYTFIGPAGDKLTAVVLGEAMDFGDKAVPKAMSVAFRTALLQALALPTDDTDPDAESYERAEKPVDTFYTLMEAIRSSQTLDALSQAAQAVQRSNSPVTPKQEGALRAAWQTRKIELEGATPSP